MADVFLSYFNKDRQRVERIAKLLEAQGISVWWDTTLKAGEHWGEVIEHELAAAQCVVVCWSDGAVKSRWVREEANQGLKRNILVPLLLEGIEPPVGFQMIQAKDISAWTGSAEAAVARDVVNAVNAVLQRPSVTQVVAPAPKPSRGIAGWALVAAAIVAAVGIYSWTRPAPLPPPKATIVVPPQPSTADIARVWDQIKDEDSIPLFEDFLSDFGKHSTTHARLARNRIAKLKAEATKAAAAAKPAAGPAKPTVPALTNIRPWAFGPDGTLNPSSSKAGSWSCLALSRESCGRLPGCYWDDKSGLVGGCKRLVSNSGTLLDGATKPSSGGPTKPTTSPSSLGRPFFICHATTKDECNSKINCFWDTTGPAASCKPMSDLGTAKNAPSTPTLGPSASITDLLPCNTWSKETDCRKHSAKCVWLGFFDLGCVAKQSKK